MKRISVLLNTSDTYLHFIDFEFRYVHSIFTCVYKYRFALLHEYIRIGQSFQERRKWTLRGECVSKICCYILIRNYTFMQTSWVLKQCWLRLNNNPMQFNSIQSDWTESNRFEFNIQLTSKAHSILEHTTALSVIANKPIHSTNIHLTTQRYSVCIHFSTVVLFVHCLKVKIMANKVCDVH